jgi:hypothetical protein
LNVFVTAVFDIFYTIFMLEVFVTADFWYIWWLGYESVCILVEIITGVRLSATFLWGGCNFGRYRHPYLSCSSILYDFTF